MRFLDLQGLYVFWTAGLMTVTDMVQPILNQFSSNMVDVGTMHVVCYSYYTLVS